MDRFQNIKNGTEIKFYNHMPCRDIIKYVDKKIWDNYFKFTVERNPFDKVVSFFFWRNGFAHHKYNTVTEFILNGGLHNLEAYDIYSINQLVAVDKIYQYEDLENFEKDLTERLGLKTPFRLPSFKAKSRKVKSYQELLDAKAVELIKVIFAREIQLLKYQY